MEPRSTTIEDFGLFLILFLVGIVIVQIIQLCWIADIKRPVYSIEQKVGSYECARKAK